MITEVTPYTGYSSKRNIYNGIQPSLQLWPRSRYIRAAQYLTIYYLVRLELLASSLLTLDTDSTNKIAEFLVSRQSEELS